MEHSIDEDAKADISALTMKELHSCLSGVLKITRLLLKDKDLLVRHILHSASPETVQSIRSLGRRKLEEKEREKEERLQTKKRKRTEDQQARRVARKLDSVTTEDARSNADEYERDPSKYLALPTDAEVKGCYRRFHNATSNHALKSLICGVCAREVSVLSDKPKLIEIGRIPHSSRLQPLRPHPAHDLYDGLLLEPMGIEKTVDAVQVRICHTCLGDLEREDRSNPPPLSLANNLWIGRIPWQLQVLTFAEQLLVAHVYPRVYTFKLFPKKIGGSRDHDNLQRGMRGNISSYELNMDGITSMLEGSLMPRPPAILASIVTITFIGVGHLPKSSLWNTFRVRRHAVAQALQWLQENNPKYYSQINISSERLSALPEDDVPSEIIDIVRQSTDTGIVDQESDGYVPSSEVEELDTCIDEGGNAFQATPTTHSSGNDNLDEPDVIPYTISGATDTDLSKVTANELMTWGLENLWKDGKEGSYAVRHGRKPVNDFGQSHGGILRESEDFDRPNYFEQAFPGVFPFGCGGIETDRPEDLSFGEHIKWCLQYHDKRFRKHETFPFVAFGILQRRQALNSAHIQMRRRNFDSDARILSSITLEKLEQARQEEEKKLPISNPAVRLLRKHIHATGGRVMGSDQSRYQLRSQIWSTSVYLSPPSLWITINPCDLHDPIAQVFAGEDINMDNFIATMGPSKDQRAQNIANDPYAAAKFFHYIIHTILETLFGIEVTPFHIRSNPGIFGKVAAYFGAVESQGRGSLHLHIILWLKNAPSSDEMCELLKKPEFRNQVKDFIKTNIHAYVPGLETAESVKAIPNEVGIAYSRPPHPDNPNFDADISSYERRLARAKQLHTCELRRCIIFNSQGHAKCKRRAPFEVAEEEYIREDGGWAPKRLYGYLNSWNPATLTHVCCNNDIKLLMSNREACSVGEYISTYVLKKQGKNHNTSALMARGYAYHTQSSNSTTTLKDNQRLLIFRLVHTVNREQELAAPMVMSYLMGWEDIYRSHHYTPIFWSSFTGALLKDFPELSPLRLTSRESNQSVGAQEAGVNISLRQNEGVVEPGDDLVSLQPDSVGRLMKKCQIIDYGLRGSALGDYNMLRYFVDTYEEDIPANERPSKGTTEHLGSCNSNDDSDIGHPQRGRRRNLRVSYHADHPLFKSKRCVVRTPGHTNLPNFVGPFFPRSDDKEICSYYYACMLVLLKPWRSLKTDLKTPEQTWEEAFNAFLQSSPSSIHHILSGIQYFHECKSAVKQDQTADLSRFTSQDYQENALNPDDSLDLGEDVQTASAGGLSLSEEGLQELITSLISWPEQNHGRHAVQAAILTHIFEESDVESWQLGTSSVRSAAGDDLQRLLEWRAQMDADVNQQNSGSCASAANGNEASAGGTVTQLGSSDKGSVTHHDHDSILAVDKGIETSEDTLPPVDPSQLKIDQRRAYDIVTWHLDQTLAGSKPPPLRMILHGEGGTGKSKVIQTITQAFEHRKAKSLLLKSAYTGVAASLIDGKTTHTIGMISQSGRPMSDAAKGKLQKLWENYSYLIIDEFSMISKTFLAKLSRNISIGKAGTGDGSGISESFGGINVILCGDLHQFPPVAAGKRDPLYYSLNSVRDSIDMELGRTIYEEFSTVVILREQVRVTDPEWRDFLRHLRYGRVQEHHVSMLRELLITNPASPSTDFTAPPWDDLCLVTPRHGVRKEWNDSAIAKHCQKTGHQLFICTAEDTIRNRPLSLVERYAVALRGRGEGKRKRRNDLPETVQLAVGMKVMVTQNVETDLDVTNGARGKIVDIVLHPDEPPIGNECLVHLTHLPSYVLVKMYRTRITKLGGLEESVIPVEPIPRTFTITLNVQGKSHSRTVKRRQFPMTAAYAFTDYRSQGQTIANVLVDIATPPTGGLSLFNMYVALSRSSGRSSIRLLRDFDNEIFKTTHDPELLAEDDRLENLDRETKAWWAKMTLGTVGTFRNDE